MECSCKFSSRSACRATEGKITSKKIVELISDFMESKKGEDIVVLDLRKSTVICDYFIICTANSNIHSKAIYEHIVEKLKKKKIYKKSIQGIKEGKWVLIDYGLIIIHILTPEYRKFYNLEKLWHKEI